MRCGYGNGHDEATLAICHKAAEQACRPHKLRGHSCTRRRAAPKDLVYAYMWFLITSEQITQAKNYVNKAMTMDQLLEAEQRAAEWMRKTKRIPRSAKGASGA